jgi:hypothetical protein
MVVDMVVVPELGMIARRVSGEGGVPEEWMKENHRRVDKKVGYIYRQGKRDGLRNIQRGCSYSSRGTIHHFLLNDVTHGPSRSVLG